MIDANTINADYLLERREKPYARVLEGKVVTVMHTVCFAKGLKAGRRRGASVEFSWVRPNAPCPGCGH